MSARGALGGLVLAAIVAGVPGCRQLLGIDDPVVTRDGGGGGGGGGGGNADGAVVIGDGPRDAFVLDAVAVGGPHFVQGTSATTTSGTSLVATLPDAVQRGDLIVVAVGALDGGMQIKKVGDTFPTNAYAVAAPEESAGNLAEAMLFAVSTGSGSDHVTVQFSRSESFVDVRVGVYRSLVSDGTGQAVDVIASAHDTSGTATVSLTTQHADELIVAADYTDGTTTGPGPGMMLRELSSDHDLLEDRLGDVGETYTVDAELQTPVTWAMQAVSFVSN
nr:hypothetical protein [Kofleriaceae bacterium]